MYQVLFHIKMAKNYLKYDKKIPELIKNRLYKLLDELLEMAEKAKQEYY